MRFNRVSPALTGIILAVSACADPAGPTLDVPQRVARSTTAETAELIGSYTLSYYYNAAGCSNVEPNPYQCVQVTPGPVRVPAAIATPGRYRVTATRWGSEPVGGIRIWSGDATAGTMYAPVENGNLDFDHGSGEISLYFWDWVPWDNNPNAGWILTLYRLPPVAPNSPPSVNAGGPYTSGEGGAIALTWSASDPDGDPLTYTWNFGNGVTGSGSVLPTSYAYPDNPAAPVTAFTITITANDGKGGTATVSTNATVTNAAPTATFGYPTSATLGASVPLSLSSASDMSPTDAAAGFTYAFDCGTGYGPFGNSPTTTCPAATAGTHTVKGMVRDKDSGSSEYIGTMQIDYMFDGFARPVSNGGVLNLAKAGQAIPLKWRLTDASGVPVTSLATATITVKDLNCPLGSTADQVEEYATGSAGLVNLGDGYYQLNWKTPSTYARSCKMLQVNLGEGSGPRTALFQFTK